MATRKKPQQQGSEVFEEVDGKRTDARLHERILDNPRADARLAAAAVRAAIADGMSRDDAERIYGAPKR